MEQGRSSVADRLSRADRFEAVLRQIESVTAQEPANRYINVIARRALDDDAALPGPVAYRDPKDYAMAQEWMRTHQRADQLVFVTEGEGRSPLPVAAIYIEPVASYYEAGRRELMRIAAVIANEHDLDDYFEDLTNP
jgi:hypothetical protein